MNDEFTVSQSIFYSYKTLSLVTIQPGGVKMSKGIHNISLSDRLSVPLPPRWLGHLHCMLLSHTC